jgi:hypothetical protein
MVSSGKPIVLERLLDDLGLQRRLNLARSVPCPPMLPDAGRILMRRAETNMASAVRPVEIANNAVTRS